MKKLAFFGLVPLLLTACGKEPAGMYNVRYEAIGTIKSFRFTHDGKWHQYNDKPVEAILDTSFTETGGTMLKLEVRGYYEPNDSGPAYDERYGVLGRIYVNGREVVTSQEPFGYGNYQDTLIVGASYLLPR